MTRALTATSGVLDENTMLAFYSRFAWAEVKGASLEWDQNLGAGGANIALHVKLPDGTKITEVMQLSELLTEWGRQILAEHGVTA